MRMTLAKSFVFSCSLVLIQAQVFGAEPVPCVSQDSLFSLPTIGLEQSNEHSGPILREPDLSLSDAIRAIGVPTLQTRFGKETVAEWHFAFRRGRTSERCTGMNPSTTYETEAYILKFRFGTYRRPRCEASRFIFDSPNPEFDLSEVSIVDKKSLDCSTLLDTLWPRGGLAGQIPTNAGVATRHH